MWEQHSQSKDLKAFFGTLVAHGNPRSPFRLHSNTVQSSSKTDTALSAAGTLFQLSKDVGEMANHVPYVKAVTGVLSQIIKIREEIQANKDRRMEIIDLVQQKTVTILQALEMIYRANKAEGLEDLKADLEGYADFLRVILRDHLEPYKARTSYKSYANRGKDAEDLRRLERELDSFKDRFLIKRVVAISVDVRTKGHALPEQSNISSKITLQALPPPPKHTFGRDSIIKSIVDDTISSAEPRHALLGPGGFGKTTLATKIMHDTRFQSKYPTQYFVSCELAPTVQLLKTRLADILSIPQSDRGTNLSTHLVDRICGHEHPVALFIDNMETVWDEEDEQLEVESFLNILSGLGAKLALFITMRGTQAPNTSFRWNKLVVRGLGGSDSTAMYEALSSQPPDAAAAGMLAKLSGIPLAIKLFASMVEDGDEPSDLLTRWDQQGTLSLETGAHRLSNLDKSIHISVFSPRLNDSARLVLGLQALLPDGLSTEPKWLQAFQSILPDDVNLQSAQLSLRRAALLEKRGSPPRWQMLPPVMEFCRRLLGSTDQVVLSLIRIYAKIVVENYDLSSRPSQDVILPELANIRALLIKGLGSPSLLPSVADAAAQYGHWTMWRGISDLTVLEKMLSLPLPVAQKARVRKCMGDLYESQGKLDTAEELLCHAWELYRQMDDFWETAHTQESLGKVYLGQDRLHDAETSFSHALDLYREIENLHGEANSYVHLGELNIRRNQLDAAQSLLSRAFELNARLHNPWSVAFSYLLLGRLQILQEDFASANEAFSQALVLWNELEIGERGGTAMTLTAISELQLHMNQLDEAENSLDRVLEIYATTGCKIKADTYRSIGKLHLRLDQLETSERALRRALVLEITASSRLGQAMTHRCLSELFSLKGDLESAESSLKEALRLLIAIEDYQADSCLKELGILWGKQGKIIQSEATGLEGLRERWRSEEVVSVAH